MERDVSTALSVMPDENIRCSPQQAKHRDKNQHYQTKINTYEYPQNTQASAL